MRHTYTLAALLLSSIAFSQINIQWASRYTSGGNNVDRAAELARDLAGNVYVTGTSWNGSNFDIVTVKYDPNGAQQWMASYNGAGNGYDEGRGIAVDVNGFVYVCGYTQGASSNYNYITIQYDAAGGVQQWATPYDGPAAGFDEAYDIAVDAGGNSYVTGSSTGSTSSLDYATIKYNNAGVQQWATRYSNNNSNSEAAYSIALDGSGNVYVTGSSWGGNTPDYDIATIKYNNAGAQQWVTRYNGPGSRLDSPNDIAVDGGGNVYVTGYHRALTGITNYDIVTIKYNSAGAQQWATPYAGAGNEDDRGNALVITPGGDVVVTGRSIGTSQTAEDCVTLLYNGTSGAQTWENRYDGGVVNYDEGRDVMLDVAGNIYVTGYSYSTGTNNNYLTMKFDAAGNRLWLTKYVGPVSNGSDQAFSMDVDVIGNVYVTGLSRGTGTNEDYYTIKYCQLTAMAGSDTAICLGDAVNLQAALDSGTIDSVWWLPQTGLSNPNIANPTASPNSTTSYVLHLRNANGCIDLDTVTVTVNPLPGPSITAGGPTTFCLGDSVMLTANTGGPSTYLWSPGGQTSQSVVVSMGATYSVTVSDTNTCSSQSQITVTVNQPPTVIAGNDVNLCTSTQVQICASGAQTFSWAPSFGVSDTTIACPTFGPTSSTTYIVNGTDTNGCVDSDTVMVNLLPPPPVPSVSMMNVDELHATPGYNSYQWYFNGNPIGGATDSIYVPTQNGNYYVVVTDTNNCSTFSGTFVLNDVGMHENFAAGSLLLFPNPGNGAFTLSADLAGEKALLQIFDATGRRVYEEQLPPAGRMQKQISLHDAPEGLYFLRLYSSTGERSARLTIMR